MADTATERQRWTEQEKALIEAYRVALYAADDAGEAESRANVERCAAENRYTAAVGRAAEARETREGISVLLRKQNLDVAQIAADLREMRDKRTEIG